MRALILGSSSAGLLGSSCAGPLKEMLDRLALMVRRPPRRSVDADLAQQLGELLSPPAHTAGMTAMSECDFSQAEHDDHERPGALRLTSAQLVVEIVTPDENSWEKLPFYAAHHVSELVIVDPTERAVYWLALDEAQGEYRAIERSGLIDLDPFKLADQLEEQDRE